MHPDRSYNSKSRIIWVQMLDIQIYIYTHIFVVFVFLPVGSMFFSTKVSFFPYIFGSFFPDLSLRTLEGRDATVTFVHQGRISMKGTVNVARSGREKKPGETETKTTGYLGEVG